MVCLCWIAKYRSGRGLSVSYQEVQKRAYGLLFCIAKERSGAWLAVFTREVEKRACGLSPLIRALPVEIAGLPAFNQAETGGAFLVCFSCVLLLCACGSSLTREFQWGFSCPK